MSRVPASGLLAEATDELTAAGSASPRADARTLLCHVAGIERFTLEPKLTPYQHTAFLDSLRRRIAGEPVQHITGRAYFRHVGVAVGPGVFIPRPETETMTGWAIDRLRELVAGGVAAPRVVELCAGSGAISLAIHHEVSQAVITAVELSPEACEWARRNLRDTPIELHEGDLSDPLGVEGEVDLVIANPPYIPLVAWESVPAEVRDHDPQLALFSGPDGLDVMRVLTGRGAELLRPGGRICVEHAEANAEQTVELFARHGGWKQVRDHRDLTDRPRFTTATRLAG